MKKLIAGLLLLSLPIHAQEYFDYTDDLIPGTTARPDVIDSNFQAIETAFTNIAADFFVTLWQGDWVTGKEYLVNAFVLESGTVYICVEDHTSGTFATDLADEKWEAVLTQTIGDDSITDAKLRDSAAVSIIGRSANTSGDPADIAAAGNDTLLRRVSDALGFGQLTSAMFPAGVVESAAIEDLAVGTTKLADDAVTADKLASSSVVTGSIVNNAVDNGKIRDSAAVSVIGRSANSSGDPADITAAANDQVLRRTSDALSFGAVPDAALSANAALYDGDMAQFSTGTLPDARLSSNVGLVTSGDFIVSYATACTTTPTQDFRYWTVGKLVTIVATTGTGLCTSDADRFDGDAAMPAAIRPDHTVNAVIPNLLDNNTEGFGCLTVLTTGAIQYYFGPDCAFATWTASGTKSAGIGYQASWVLD